MIAVHRDLALLNQLLDQLTLICTIARRQVHILQDDLLVKACTIRPQHTSTGDFDHGVSSILGDVQEFGQIRIRCFLALQQTAQIQDILAVRV